MEGKVRDVGINTAIVVTSASNVGTGFVEPMEQLKLALENIVSTDHLLNRGKGTNVECDNGCRTTPGCMGINIVNGRARIWKSQRYLSDF